ncbi:aspartate aminotransferase family protein [Candidatus Obscuribacterales bacterium]|nr:aspartate aminotransferase family protein [Candidatus Obscuribacterales bacterium]MBX3136017.1 aspartate aminotransferase family protein [Candidatus Obscuribacterales bacterium]MBX3148797.1 aspartate aminotransferase family protein [Candidatus Obscuribacterales bacterium]
MTAQLNREELKKKREKYLFPSVKQMYTDPPHFVKGKMQYLYDETGREYLDMFAGIVTVSVGHCNPKVLAKTVEQVQTLQHTSTVFMTQPMVDLAEKLANIAPGNLSKSFITNSGTEANEAAIKVARVSSGRNEVIALRHSYHGESHLASTLTANHHYRPEIMPAAGIVHAANAYCYRCPFQKTPDSCNMECVQDLERTIQMQTSGKPAVFIAEPIQGVGGTITPPDDYFIQVKKVLEQYGVLMIADEVQTGVGRTGTHWFGIQSYGVTPDLITMAKGLGNGLPIGAVITTPEIADKAAKQQINTFGGNPVSAATGCAVLDVIEEENLMANAKEVGGYIKAGMEDLQKHFPDLIGDVRGKGLMLGMEIADKKKNPLSAETAKIVEMAKDDGVVIGKGGVFGNVIRIKPAMNITKDNADQLLKVMKKALEATAKVGAAAK